MHAVYCVWFLKSLEAEAQRRGPDPEADLLALGRLFGSQMTLGGCAVVFIYWKLQASQRKWPSSTSRAKKSITKLRLEEDSRQNTDAHIQKVSLMEDQVENATRVVPHRLAKTDTGNFA